MAGEKSFEVTTSPGDFEKVRQALEQEGIVFVVAEITQIPQSLLRLEEKAAERMLKLVEALDDYEDVQKVYANFDIPEQIMAALSA